MDLLELAMRADKVGIKLEMVNGLPTWEGMPSYRHQRTIDRIRATLPQGEPAPGGCACIHIADTYFLFPDGSLKRPDVAILCAEPPEAQQETAIRQIPEAVIEIISKGYESKDLELGPHFYLMHGVKDVVVFDPGTGLVLHIRKDGRKHLISPVKLHLECGCDVTV